MSQLPAGWALATIHDLVQFNPKSEASDNAICGFVPMAGLGTKYGAQLKVHEERPWSEVKRAYTHFKNGDVLIAKVTPCFENGKAGIANDLPSGLGAGSSEFCVFRPSSGLDGRYLLGWFSSEDFRRRATLAMTGSVGLKRVPKDVFLGEQVPLAPAGEQQRIADKLDTLLARVDDVSARLARVAPLLKRFRQSVLAAATSGRLTEDWRNENSAGSCEASKLLADIQKEKLAWAGTYSAHNEARRVMTRALDFKVRATPPSLPVGWRQAQLEDVVLMVVDCHNKTAPYSANGVPLIRTTNIRFGAFQWDELKYVDDETYVKWSRRCLPEPGDLVFTREAPMGEVAIIPPGARYCLGQRTMLIRPLDQLLSAKYLRLVIMSPAFAAYSGELAVGTGVKHLRVGDVSELRVPVQSRAEQTEIVRRVELLFAFADRLEARLSAAQTATQRLTPALLAKAFRGELVAQDPNDEPAAELLKRLAAQRAAAPTTSTRSRKTTGRNVAGDAC
jgi:type I restriction enzyme S subunit